eukprot:TRINITY_DN16991_c0_g1_i1.p1 TRINITY_DN16991_c0_g1~~TRINITY_DN16991_c0_g1_i1.p1  ORF type:complete len:468 (-),score=56.55 TRINITY_DN16991_c0_g1_i1:31-1434(-)
MRRALVLLVASMVAASPLLSLSKEAAANVPLCPGGKATARQPFLWNILYNDAGGVDLAGTPGVATQGVATAYPGGSDPGWPTNSFGIWPICIGSGTTPQCTDGGVPQNASLPNHLANLQKSIPQLFPDPNYDGVIGIDWEGWAEVYDGFLFTGYKTVSQALVTAKHPDWNTTQVEQEAAKEFNAAAQEFMTQTLRTCKTLLPKAKWGLYGTPPKLWHSYNDPEYAPSQRAHNDALAWLWQEVDVLMPELYFKTVNETLQSAYFNRGLMGEAERVLAAHARPGTGIVPYTWQRAGHDFLTPDDLRAQMLLPYEFQHTEAVLVWGDPAVGGVTLEALQKYFVSTFKPLIVEFETAQCNCAVSNCSSHGRCYANLTKCECDAGWTGTNCASAYAPEVISTLETFEVETITCPDGLSACPDGSTCGQLSSGRWYCCPSAQAVLCHDFLHCCPHGTTCNMTNTRTKTGICIP